MGSVTYNFLADSLLFDEGRLEDSFAGVTDGELEAELQRYCGFCEEHAEELFSEVDNHHSSLVVLSDESLDTVNLAQAALYVNQYLFHDPILELLNKPIEATRVMNEYLGMKSSDGLDRAKMVKILRQMKTLTPMVAAGFLKFLPLGIGQSNKGELPLKYSDNYFEDVLPQEILRLFREAAVVRTMRRVPQGFVLERTLYPARAVNINFKGHPYHDDFAYLLWEQELENLNEGEGTFKAKLSLPDDAPAPAYFNVWVRQSVNQAAAALFSQAEKTLFTAAKLNAVVGSHSDLLFKAIQKVYKPHSSVPMKTANVLLNLELPFLSGLQIEDLMRLRQEEGGAFRRFRLLLDQKLGGIRAAVDSDEAKREVEFAVHELTEVRMEELDSKIRGVRDKFVANSVVAILGFAAAVQTGGFSLLAAAQGVVGIGKTLVAYRMDIKRNPAFFLWKTLKK
jgi:hypothetical protein